MNIDTLSMTIGDSWKKYFKVKELGNDLYVVENLELGTKVVCGSPRIVSQVLMTSMAMRDYKTLPYTSELITCKSGLLLDICPYTYESDRLKYLVDQAVI